jgi:hypothetical protein
VLPPYPIGCLRQALDRLPVEGVFHHQIPLVLELLSLAVGQVLGRLVDTMRLPHRSVDALPGLPVLFLPQGDPRPSRIL